MKLSFLERFCKGKGSLSFLFVLRLMVFGWVIIGLVTTSGAAPGDLDPTFGSGGKVITAVGNSFEICNSMASQADGKIVVIGYVYTDSGSDFAIVRYHSDGTLDTTFGIGGKVKTNLGARSFDTAASIAIQPDGKIVVAGHTMNPDSNFIISDFAVVRYNSDGSLDPSFGSNGIVVTRLGAFTSSYATSIKIQPDGKIVVAGHKGEAGVVMKGFEGDDNYTFAVARYKSDGSLDTTFDGDGIVFTNITTVADVASSVVIQSDGKIIVGGYDSQFINNTLVTSQNILVRYNVDGSLDPTFGNNGIVITSPPPGFEQIALNGIAIQPDGKIVGAGRISTPPPFGYSYLVTRYNPNGSLDASFDSDGFVTTRIRNGFNDAYSTAIQPNGKIVIVGMVSLEGTPFADFAAARYNPNGSLDTSFGDGGTVVTTFGTASDDGATSILIQPNGKIIAAGNSYNQDFNRSFFVLARYQGDFRSSGQSLFDFDGDGKTDISIFRPSLGEWWYSRSSDGQVPALQFGNSADKLMPADFTGDGKTDIAFWRPASGEWFILRSEDNSFLTFPFGVSGDIPIVGDFDADGRSDPGVFRPSSATWFILQSSGGTSIQQFGTAGDLPVISDYDGDGKSDIGIFRPNGASGAEWWISRSTAGILSVQFGSSTDKPVQGDYTGDGKADIAFFRPSTSFWYILRSEDNSFYSFPFGAAGDTPAAGDYDGDGRFDPAVFRPDSATWFINRTTAGVLITNFGASGDQPVPSAFVP